MSPDYYDEEDLDAESDEFGDEWYDDEQDLCSCGSGLLEGECECDNDEPEEEEDFICQNPDCRYEFTHWDAEYKFCPSCGFSVQQPSPVSAEVKHELG